MGRIMNNLIISIINEIETDIQSAINNEKISLDRTGINNVDQGKIQGLKEAQHIVKRNLEKFLKQSFPVALYKSDLTEKGIESLLDRLTIDKNGKDNFHGMVLYIVGAEVIIKFPDKGVQYINLVLSDGNLKIIGRLEST